MPDFVPPQDQRCQFLWKNGKQCRDYREPGADHEYCKPHFRFVQRDLQMPEEPWPAWLADEILPEGATLESAASVNAALTRLLRVALAGRIPARHAGAIGYLVQHILATLPGLKSEAKDKPAHPVLGHDPDAALNNLVRALTSALPRTKPNPAPNDPDPQPGEAA